MPMLFCNIGWMENYVGLNDGDKITGGGKYVTQNKRGFEICNFGRSLNGMAYGYVQPILTSNAINLERIEETIEGDHIDGVTVVWTAKREGLGTVIVGWYNNARVYRNFQEFKRESELHKSNAVDGYYITAKAEDTYLLPLDHRVFRVPRRQKGAMGQSNVWYADQAIGKAFKKDVQNYIAQITDELNNKSKFRPKKNIDQVKKLKVEENAINLVMSYYRGLKYSVESVERDNLGYDLIATNDKIKLLIEVKGLSGLAKQVGLTPNEYKYFQLNDLNYRLVIVNDALNQPTMTICRFSKEKDKWISEDNDASNVNVEPKMAAIITLT